MQNAQEIYAQKVRQLPSPEKLRLAVLILSDLTEEENFQNRKISALTLLEELPEERLFQTAEEVDDYLKRERESWEN